MYRVLYCLLYFIHVSLLPFLTCELGRVFHVICPNFMSSPSFELVTSFRYDIRLRSVSCNTPFFLLPFHLERLVCGARHFGWARALEALGVQDGARHRSAHDEAYADALERFRRLCQGCVDAYVAEHPECSAEQALKVRFYDVGVLTHLYPALSCPTRCENHFLTSAYRSA